jgi:hypothetical protein
MFSWDKYLARYMCAETHPEYPLVLSAFIQIWNLPTNINKTPYYQICENLFSGSRVVT